MKTKTFWYSYFKGTKENLIAFAKAIEVQDAETKLGDKLEAMLAYGFTKPSKEWDEFLQTNLQKYNISHEYKSFEV